MIMSQQQDAHIEESPSRRMDTQPLASQISLASARFAKLSQSILSRHSNQPQSLDNSDPVEYQRQLSNLRQQLAESEKMMELYSAERQSVAYKILRQSRSLIFEQVKSIMDELKQNQKVLKRLKKLEKAQLKIERQLMMQKKELMQTQESSNNFTRLEIKIKTSLEEVHRKQKQLVWLLEEAKMQEIQNETSFEYMSKYQSLLMKRDALVSDIQAFQDHQRSEVLIRQTNVVKTATKLNEVDEVLQKLITATQEQKKIIQQIQHQEGIDLKSLIHNMGKTNSLVESRYEEQQHFNFMKRKGILPDAAGEASSTCNFSPFSSFGGKQILSATIRRHHMNSSEVKKKDQIKKRFNTDISRRNSLNKQSLDVAANHLPVTSLPHSKKFIRRNSQQIPGNTSSISDFMRSKYEDEGRGSQKIRSIRIKRRHGYEYNSYSEHKQQQNLPKIGKNQERESENQNEGASTEIGELYLRMINRKTYKSETNDPSQNASRDEDDRKTTKDMENSVRLLKRKQQVKGRGAKKLMLQSRQSDEQRLASPISLLNFPEESEQIRKRLNTIKERDEPSRNENQNDS